MRRFTILTFWSATGTFAGAILLAAVYHQLITPVGPPPDYFSVLKWTLLGWSPWILFAPLVILLGERISLRHRQNWKSRLLSHALIAAAIVIAHGFWFAAASVWSAPYISVQEYGSALRNYAVFDSPIAVLLYCVLAIGISRAVSALPRFRATPGGFLQTDPAVPPGFPGLSDTAMEAMPGPVLVYDPDALNILAVNPSATVQYGWTAEEFSRMSLLEIRPPENVPELLKHLNRTRNLPIWRASSRHRKKDGTIFEIELTNLAVVFNGRMARMILVTDVTAAERAQRALEESERKSREIIEHAVIGFFQSTPNGRLLMLNRSAAEALGYDSPEEAVASISDIGRDIYVDPRDRLKYLEAIRRDGYVSNWMSKLRRRDGSIMWNMENSRGVFDADGNLEYVEGTIKDMTDEVQAREALQESERRASALRVQLANAQLRALKLQLKPHFLFNLLNTIAMMIRIGEVDKAQRVVTLLGDMFRRFLEFEGEETVALEHEISFLDMYLGLEQYRYEDRMEVHREIDHGLLGIRVPTLILQPIAENAIKHGVAKMSAKCRIDLAARRVGDDLLIELVNDAGRPDWIGENPGHGIGLSNTRARLRELYGDRASFELIPRNGRVHAILRIPEAGRDG